MYRRKTRYIILLQYYIQKNTSKQKYGIVSLDYDTFSKDSYGLEQWLIMLLIVVYRGEDDKMLYCTYGCNIDISDAIDQSFRSKWSFLRKTSPRRVNGDPFLHTLRHCDCRYDVAEYVSTVSSTRLINSCV